MASFEIKTDSLMEVLETVVTYLHAAGSTDMKSTYEFSCGSKITIQFKTPKPPKLPKTRKMPKLAKEQGSEHT